MNYYKFNFNNIYCKANLNLFEFYLFFFMFLIFIYLFYQRNFLNFIIYIIFNYFKINNVHIFFIFISYFVCKVVSFLLLNFFRDVSKDSKIYITMIMLYK